MKENKMRIEINGKITEAGKLLIAEEVGKKIPVPAERLKAFVPNSYDDFKYFSDIAKHIQDRVLEVLNKNNLTWKHLVATSAVRELFDNYEFFLIGGDETLLLTSDGEFVSELDNGSAAAKYKFGVRRLVSSSRPSIRNFSELFSGLGSIMGFSIGSYELEKVEELKIEDTDSKLGICMKILHSYDIYNLLPISISFLRLAKLRYFELKRAKLL
jgi:hypothetical protein